MTPRGRFITIEGGEGTGKSTLITGLRARPALANAVFTREPGGSAGAEEIRGLLVTGEPDRWDAVTELLLLNAARRDHVARTIEPALAAGQHVICDRYVDSTRAYQGLRDVPRDMIETIHSQTVALDPDVTLILDAPAEIGLQRAATRHGPDRFERMGLDFHTGLRAAFLSIAENAPDRCIIVDATQSADAVLAQVTTALEARL